MLISFQISEVKTKVREAIALLFGIAFSVIMLHQLLIPSLGH
jgi:hypothetical protein